MYSVWFSTTAEYSNMFHGLPRNASFWQFLFSIDQDLAESARKEACPCGVGCTGRIILGSRGAVPVICPTNTPIG